MYLKLIYNHILNVIHLVEKRNQEEESFCNKCPLMNNLSLNEPDLTEILPYSTLNSMFCNVSSCVSSCSVKSNDNKKNRNDDGIT